MARPSLEDLTPGMFRTVMDTLGDTIGYKAAGAASYTQIKASGDYRDMARAFDAAQVIEQDMTFSVLMTDLAARPMKADRIQLPKVPGVTFRPENVRRDASGYEWEFELRIVAGA